MAHTFTKLMYHVVFSTAGRRKWLPADVKARLVEFAGGVVRQRGGTLLAMNGTEDHVHLLVALPAAKAVNDQVRDIEALSSGWMNDRFRELGDFRWQDGYSAFTVGAQNVDPVKRYIANQEAHHRQTTFEEELLALLDRAGIE